MWLPYRLRHKSQLNQSTITIQQSLYVAASITSGLPSTINHHITTNIPAESTTSPSSSQRRAAREQSSSAQTPRIERVGEYSNENTSSSPPPHTENIVKRRLETNNRGRVRFKNTTWARDNCSPVHFIPFTNTKQPSYDVRSHDCRCTLHGPLRPK